MVICSIHQPSSAAFQLFDTVMLLSKGQQVYFGPVPGVGAYCSSIGRPIPDHYNPADYCLEITNTDFAGAVTEQDIVVFCQQWQESKELADVKVEIEQSKQRATATISEVDLATMDSGDVSLGSRPGILLQIITLVNRGFLKSYRDLTPYWMRVVMYVGLAIMMGTIWLRLTPDQLHIQAFISAVFFAVAFMSVMAMAYIPACLEDRNAFVKERNGGLYGAGAFCISNFIIGFPYICECITYASFSVIF